MTATHGPGDHGDSHRPFGYCPYCAAQLVVQRLKPIEPERHVCPVCDFVHFPDPKVATGCIAQTDAGIVLVRRSIEPGYGKWVFPGGYVDRGERVEDAAVREMQEECGLHVRVNRLLGVYSYAHRPIVVIVYTGTVEGGTLVAADESLDAGCFAPRALPWDELAFPSTYDALRDFLAQEHSLQPPTGARPPRA